MIHNFSEKFKNPNRVVVLGGSGFIGCALAAALAEDGIPCESIGSAMIDLTVNSSIPKLKGLVKEGDCIVMLSALTPDKGKDIKTFMTNLRMASNVCEALSGIKNIHIIYFSSDAVYSMNSALVNEETPAAPDDLYGTMHRARELMFESTFRDLCVVRPTLVFGGADTHNSYGPNRFFRAIKKEGRVTLFGGGEETRDHIFVGDLIKLTRLVLGHRVIGTLNLATGQSTSFLAIAQMVAKGFDSDVEIVTTERKMSITHRKFDITTLYKLFPNFQFSELGGALRHAYQ
jgi:UDP-glucose 4-epimerase